MAGIIVLDCAERLPYFTPAIIIEKTYGIV